MLDTLYFFLKQKHIDWFFFKFLIEPWFIVLSWNASPFYFMDCKSIISEIWFRCSYDICLKLFFTIFLYIFFTKKVENLCWLQVTHRRVKKLIYSCSVIYENKKPLLFTFFNLWIKPLKETCLKERTFKENVFKNEIESNWGILRNIANFLKWTTPDRNKTD